MYLVVPGTYTLYLISSLYPAYSIRVTMKVLDRVLLLSSTYIVLLEVSTDVLLT
ncbi:hypothetical protein WAI453_013160 [Rhynchosporium graminicola]